MVLASFLMILSCQNAIKKQRDSGACGDYFVRSCLGSNQCGRQKAGKRWIDEYFRRSQNEHLVQEEFQTKEAKSRTNPSGGHQ